MAVFNTAFAIDMTRLQFFTSVDEALECSCSYPDTQLSEVSYTSEDKSIVTLISATGTIDVTYDDDGKVTGSNGTLDGFAYLRVIDGPLPVMIEGWYLSGTSIDVALFDASTDAGRLAVLFAGEDEIAGSYFDDKLYGLDGDDTLHGWYGNDVLDGGAGQDRMIGGIGDDTYYVDQAGDIAVELRGEGDDRVFSSIGYTLKGQYIETLVLTGTADNDATGNKLANTLVGNDGDNVLNGMTGADQMSGGLGDDRYVVDNVGDRIIELPGQGYDTVDSCVSFSLSGQAIEELNLIGNRKINGTGNELANLIVGNGKGNILNGMEGNDVLTGGGGGDRFVFSTALGADNVDTITDFFAPQDSIRLDHTVFTGLTAGGLIAPEQFKDIAKGAADADDRILYDSSSGMLFFDQDGSGTDYDAIQFALIQNKEILSYRDFLVI